MGKNRDSIIKAISRLDRGEAPDRGKRSIPPKLWQERVTLARAIVDGQISLNNTQLRTQIADKSQKSEITFQNFLDTPVPKLDTQFENMGDAIRRYAWDGGVDVLDAANAEDVGGAPFDNGSAQEENLSNTLGVCVAASLLSDAKPYVAPHTGGLRFRYPEDITESFNRREVQRLDNCPGKNTQADVHMVVAPNLNKEREYRNEDAYIVEMLKLWRNVATSLSETDNQHVLLTAPGSGVFLGECDARQKERYKIISGLCMRVAFQEHPELSSGKHKQMHLPNADTALVKAYSLDCGQHGDLIDKVLNEVSRKHAVAAPKVNRRAQHQPAPAPMTNGKGKKALGSSYPVSMHPLFERSRWGQYGLQKIEIENLGPEKFIMKVFVDKNHLQHFIADIEAKTTEIPDANIDVESGMVVLGRDRMAAYYELTGLCQRSSDDMDAYEIEGGVADYQEGQRVMAEIKAWHDAKTPAAVPNAPGAAAPAAGSSSNSVKKVVTHQRTDKSKQTKQGPSAQPLPDASRAEVKGTSAAKPQARDMKLLSEHLGVELNAENTQKMESVVQEAQRSHKPILAVKTEVSEQRQRVTVKAHAEAHRDPVKALSLKAWKEVFDQNPAVVTLNGKHYEVKLHKGADQSMLYVCREQGTNARFRGLNFEEAKQAKDQLVEYMCQVAEKRGYIAVKGANNEVKSACLGQQRHSSGKKSRH